MDLSFEYARKKIGVAQESGINSLQGVPKKATRFNAIFLMF